MIALTKQYSDKNRQGKEGARKDRREWVSNMAVRSNNPNELYRITNTLSGKKRRIGKPVKNKVGDLLTDHNAQRDRWSEYFGELLNQQDEEWCLEGSPVATWERRKREPRRKIYIGDEPPSLMEIVETINALKNDKSPGIDSIEVELLKAWPEGVVGRLLQLFQEVWVDAVLPKN